MWSVVIEIQYYAMVACVGLPLFRRIGKFIFVVIYGFIVITLLIARSFSILEISFGISAVKYLVKMNVDFIAAGGLVAVWWSHNRDRNVDSSKPGIICIAFVILATCFILMFLPNRLDTSNWRHINYIIILCSSIYILKLTLNYPIINKHILHRICLYLGDIAYSVYLYHLTIFVIIWWMVVLYVPSIFYKTPAYETIQLSGLLLSVVMFSRVFMLIEKTGIMLGSRLQK